MNLVKLQIERENWGAEKGKYNGIIEFDNELGKVAIKLTHEKCKELFNVVAEGIVETAKIAASELTCNIIENNQKIEHK